MLPFNLRRYAISSGLQAHANDFADYHTIQAELGAYGQGLLSRPQIIALNKVDAAGVEIKEMAMTELTHLTSAPIFPISAVAHRGLEPFLQAVWDALDRVRDSSTRV